MKKVAIIEERYVRDAQVFTEDSNLFENTPDWEKYFMDIKYPNLYVGIFEGNSEDEIQQKAADSQGVHPDIITLIGFGQIDCINCRNQPIKIKTDRLDEQDDILCPSCGYNLGTIDYYGYNCFPKFCSDCGQRLN